MTQFFFGFFRTIAIITVIALGLNAARLYAAQVQIKTDRQIDTQFTKYFRSNGRSQELPLQVVAFKPEATPTIPVLLLADPGLAYVLSSPSRHLQITIEGENRICLDQLTATDSSGTLQYPMANTKNCTAPRLVVLH